MPNTEENLRLRVRVAELEGRLRALERIVDTLTTALETANHMNRSMREVA